MSGNHSSFSLFNDLSENQPSTIKTMAWQDLPPSRKSSERSFQPSSQGRLGINHLAMPYNKQRMGIVALAFGIVVFLVLLCATLGFVVHQSKKNNDDLAYLSSVLEEHLQDSRHIHDDPPQENNVGGGNFYEGGTKSPTPPTIPTMSPSVIEVAPSPFESESLMPSSDESIMPNLVESVVPTFPDTSIGLVPNPAESVVPTISETLLGFPIETPVLFPVYAPVESPAPTSTIATGQPTIAGLPTFVSPEKTPIAPFSPVAPNIGVTDEPTVPTINAPAAALIAVMVPTVGETLMPAAEETPMPFTRETLMPASEESSMPLSEESSMPLSEESSMPAVTQESPMPGTDESPMPAIVEETPMPVTEETSTPAITAESPMPVTEESPTRGSEENPMPFAPTAAPSTQGPPKTASPTEGPPSTPSGDNIWSQIGQDITWNTVVSDDATSLSMSRDGTAVAVGQFDNGVNGQFGGKVDVYRLNENGMWSPVGQAIESDLEAGLFGYSVSLNEDGTILAIGDAHDGTKSTGRVLVYELNVDTWVQRGQTLDGGGPDQFAGERVVLSDDGSIILYDVQITSRQPGPIKFVRVFRYNGSTWEKGGQDLFGQASSLIDTFSIDLSGNGGIFVIASIVPGFGYAETYQLNGNTWERNGKIIPNSTATDASAGISAAVNGDGSVLAVGIRKFQSPNLVRVYEFDNGWIQLGGDIDTKGSSSATQMTLSLSLDGQMLAVGPQDGTEFASIHIYDNVNEQWRQVGENVDADLTSNGVQLQSIDLSGSGDRVALFGLGGKNVKVYDGAIAANQKRQHKRIPSEDGLT